MDLDWPDCRNVRDVGGLATASGRPIRSGALIRADRLGALTPAGVDTVRSLGVTRILDLRSAEECSRDPNPFASDPSYLHHPVQDPTDELDWTLSRAETYLRMLGWRPKLFASAVAAFAEAPPGAVVVHCHAGKDRTGLVVALALSLAGVPEDVIAADYGRSEAGLRDVYERLLTEVTDPDERAYRLEQWSSHPETMATVLADLTARHGGAEPYLAAAGLTPAQAQAVRDRLVA